MFNSEWNKISASFLGPFATGLLVYLIIIVFHASAIVHFNPAITLAFLGSKKISVIEGLYYFLAQLLGGLSGSGFCFLTIYLSVQSGAESGLNLDDSQLNRLKSGQNQNITFNFYQEIVESYALDVKTSGNQNSNTNFSWLAILISETITTSVLCLLATLCCYNPKTFTDQTGPLCIGISVFLGIIAGTKIGAGCLNPIRSDMPWFMDFKKIYQNWTFNVGPCLGAGVSCCLFNFWFDESIDREKRYLERNRSDEEALTKSCEGTSGCRQTRSMSRGSRGSRG